MDHLCPMQLNLHRYQFDQDLSNDSSQATYDDSTFDNSTFYRDRLYDKTTSESEPSIDPLMFRRQYDTYRQPPLRRARPNRSESPPPQRYSKRKDYRHQPTATSTFIHGHDDFSDDSSDEESYAHPPGLTMLGKEFSPIPKENDVENVPPCPPMSIQKIPGYVQNAPYQNPYQNPAFHPQMTSTKTTLPRTNPNHVIGTPRGTLSRNLQRCSQRPKSLYSMGSMGYEKRNTLEFNYKFAQNNYGVPVQLAQIQGLHGTVFLGIDVNCERVKIEVIRAEYFLDKSIPQVISKFEISLVGRQDKRSRHDDKRTRTVATRENFGNSPTFNERLRMTLSERNFNEHDRLVVRCQVKLFENSSWTELGCMRFSLRSLETRPVIKGEGYFLLDKLPVDKEKGLKGSGKSNFPIKNVHHKKYYDSVTNDISVGGTTASSSLSARSTSPVKMIMNENDWPSRHLAGQNNGAMPVQAHHHQFPAPTMHQMQFQPHPASQAVGTMFPYQPNMPSCGNSSSSAPGGGLTMPMYCHYKPTQQRHQHRQNIPATTTTTMTAAGVASSGVAGLPVPPPSIQIVAATAANANRHLYGGGENLDSETSGSSNGSFDEPSGRNYHRQYRYTIPSISTTSDSCSEFSTDVTDTSRHLDIHHLYAPGPTCINEEEPSTSKDEMKALDHKQVRRVASFTCSPPESTDKYNKRVVDEKKTKPSITKKISAFFSKELTSSMSQLHHSQEEIRSWGQNLENLLNHKAGFYYLKQHMQSQRSDENIDFWKECEEYKKMKEGKKALQKAQLIYNEYLIESALRQVNLESEVMKATKAAFESGPKPDTFSLAQSKIELLIQQGPYVSFLQSPIYLNLVKPSSEDAKSAHSA